MKIIDQSMYAPSTNMPDRVNRTSKKTALDGRTNTLDRRIVLLKRGLAGLYFKKTILVKHVVTTKTKAKCKSGETFIWENPAPKTLAPKKPKLQKA